MEDRSFIELHRDPAPSRRAIPAYLFFSLGGVFAVVRPFTVLPDVVEQAIGACVAVGLWLGAAAAAARVHDERPFLVLDDAGLTVNRPFRKTVRIAWSEVQGVGQVEPSNVLHHRRLRVFTHTGDRLSVDDLPLEMDIEDVRTILVKMWQRSVDR